MLLELLHLRCVGDALILILPFVGVIVELERTHLIRPEFCNRKKFRNDYNVLRGMNGVEKERYLRNVAYLFIDVLQRWKEIDPYQHIVDGSVTRYTNYYKDLGCYK